MENMNQNPETNNEEVKVGLKTKVKAKIEKIPAPVRKGIKIGGIVLGTLAGAAILGKHVSVDTKPEDEEDDEEEVTPF